MIFHDRLVAPEVLALAPARTARVFVGKEVGAQSWPQARINAAIVAAALQGQRVVRLKSGDPSIFGRACEEIDAARAAGIDIEIVPGITAASAGAASLCRPLTGRGQTERLVIVTATCRPGDPWQGLTDVVRPGTTLAIYMAMQRLPQVEADLCRAGPGPDHEVVILSHIGTAGEKRLTTRLKGLAQAVAVAGLTNPAVIYLRIQKAGRADRVCNMQALPAGREYRVAEPQSCNGA